MARMAPEELAKKIGGGLLSFPVTHFKQDFAFDEAPYREHIEWLLKHSPAGLFAAGGTGEFFSLTMPEFASVVSAAVQQTNGRVPVVAGCGYGTAIAKQFAKAAETSGADGLLLLPPYLVNSEPAGLMAHVEAVCASTNLGVIFYNRDNAILNESSIERLCECCPNLVGFKDGVGDIELMTRIYARLGDRLTYIGGFLRPRRSLCLIWKWESRRIPLRSSTSFLSSRRRSTPPCAGGIATRSTSDCESLC